MYLIEKEPIDLFEFFEYVNVGTIRKLDELKQFWLEQKINYLKLVLTILFTET